MKKILLIAISILLTSLMTISQEKGISYQAVLRDVEENLLIEKDVTIEFAIVTQDAYNNVLFKEEHTVLTNKQGLVTLIIGTGTPLYDSFENVNWSKAYAIETYLDGEFLSHSKFTATPYALNVVGVDFEEFLTKEDLPTPIEVPSAISELDNDVGYITGDSVMTILTTTIPEIPTVPTELSKFLNDVGFITGDTLSEYTKKGELLNYTKKDTLVHYATKEYVDEKFKELYDLIKTYHKK